ncbi:MAG TPA: DegT/DnrJ/EryC1/StrS aminotransferase family protein [Thermoanaerobaculia bacterium]|jgi:dTDP-4-amino-4,6-dideoxygalactose transaminase
MNIREQFLSIAIPDISEAEIFEVIDTLKSGWISVGPKVRQFEADMAAYHGVRHAISVTSCTVGQFLMCRLLGLGEGDYAIVPTITWPSTASTVEQVGATPLFVDVDPNTLNTTPELVEPLLKQYGRRVKMISPVHVSGLPVDIDGFDALGEKYGVPVVYDAAHAVFSHYKNRRVGVYGKASLFSFYATKNITAGDGGVITTNDDELAENLRLWSYHGMDKDSWKRYSKESASPHVQCVVPGFKFNMTDLNAALAVAQLRRADEFLAIRNRLMAHYDRAIRRLPWLEATVRETPDGGWGNHVYITKVVDPDVDRDALMQVLRQYNIGTNIHFYPVHMNQFYAEKYPDVRLPVAETLAQQLLSLPLCTKYTENDLDYVVDALDDVYAKRLAHRAGGEQECIQTKSSLTA